MWTALIVIAVCALGYLVYREQHGAARLTVIRAAIADYANHVQSLEGKYSSSHVFKPTGVPGSRGQTAQHEVDFAADLKNFRMAIDLRDLEMFDDMPGVTFRFRSDNRHCDGTNFDLTYYRRTPQQEGDDWGEPHLLIISAGGERGRVGPSDLAGLASLRQGTGVGIGLVKLFANGDAYGSVHYDGKEEVNGALCERVTITIDNEQTTVWLDPEHDYLPRRQVTAGYVSLEVFEFQQFRDAVDGSLRWFPSRGMLGQSQFTVSELTINPTFDAARFRIDPASLPDGVKIRNDLTSRQWTYTGDREDLWKERDDTHNEGMRILKNGPPQ